MSEETFSFPESGVVSAQFKKRKSRFTYPEVKLLLTEVKRNRHLLVGKFNQGVSSNVKKRTWAAVTARINEISECHREVIEIVKKWSDLKCDTKRKVASMRASGLSAGLINGDLSPIERMVHKILQPGPVEKVHLSDSNSDEDELGQDPPGMPLHIAGTSNGRIAVKTLGTLYSSGINSKRETDPSLDMLCDYESAVPLTDLECNPSGTEDQGLQVSETEYQSDQNKILPEPPTADRDQIKIKTQTKGMSNSASCAGSTSHAAVFHLAPQSSGSLQEHLAKSASLSLQEQQASTVLIGTLSRSLESVAESVQRLVQTQQEFARSTLRLQRDTLHVLRDFSSSALAMMQDKSNGHP